MADTSLRYVSPETFCWMRQKHGKGFRFLDEKGAPLSPENIKRIKKLIIPPAWNDVKICQEADGHIQAIGVDARGRKQYIYNPGWIEQSQQLKFDRMIRFGEILPTLRETIAGHMRQQSLSKERVLATVVWLLEHTFIRIGNQVYAHDNKSYGLTTLREKHVDVEGKKVSFSFKGKSGVYHEVDVTHPRVVRTIQQCIDLPGYQVFQYLDEAGQRQDIDSRDVNEYLHALTGEHLSAKDFRTWGGTVLAGDTLYNLGSASSETESKKFFITTVKEVAKHLRNTVAVCRKYYIHPAIVEHHQKNTLIPHYAKVYARKSEQLRPTELSLKEYAAWELLKK